MRAHSPDTPDFGMNLMKHPENMNFLSPGHQFNHQGVGFTIAYEQYGVAAVLDTIADMVFDPAGICHTAGRNNDTGFIAEIEHFGFLHRLDIFQPFECKWVAVRLKDLLNGLIEILRVFLDNLRCCNAQWTIDKVCHIRQAV